jgi:isopentenyl diphosphate isomerase/L-lactate dehydrogenase-like FMN-dependent dehydrogenase
MPLPRAERAINIADLKELARRRLPRILFDWVEGGAEDERGLSRNEAQFARYRLLPRYLENVERIDLATTLFGRRFDAPFGIAPTGFAGLLRPDADLMLARAAAAANIPFILSGASTSSIAKTAAAGNGNVWYQLYPPRDPATCDDLIGRVSAAGVDTLVYTVDVPGEAKRERDMRNGFDLPLAITPRLVADVLSHPRWLAGYLSNGGLPVMENWAPYAPANADAVAVARTMKAHYFATQTWEDFQRIRDHWRGKLVIKGIMHPTDAERAARFGADGVIVSNHGGRQLDAAPTALEILPRIRAAVPAGHAVMLDGGFRRGADIVIAKCLGADFVFLGRATLYGAIAGGERGAARAIAIMRDEMMRIMVQIGRQAVTSLDDSCLLTVL